jgi:hypothetical protein
VKPVWSTPKGTVSVRPSQQAPERATYSQECTAWDVTVGHSQRSGPWCGRARHLLVVVSGREVLACTGGNAKERRPVLFVGVWEELGCQACRSFWKRTSAVQNL